VQLGMTAEHAVTFIKQKRCHINMGTGQFKACKDFETNLRRRLNGVETTADDSSPSSFGVAGTSSTVPSLSPVTELSVNATEPTIITTEPTVPVITPTADSATASTSNSDFSTLLASTTEADFVFVEEEEWLAAQEDAYKKEKEKHREEGEGGDDDDWEEVRTNDSGYGVGVDQLVQSQAVPLSDRANFTENSRLEGVEDFEVISRRELSSSAPNDENNYSGSKGLMSSLFKNARNFGSVLYTTLSVSAPTIPSTSSSLMASSTTQTTNHVPNQWPPVVQDCYCSRISEHPSMQQPEETDQKLSPSSSLRSSSSSSSSSSPTSSSSALPSWNPTVAPPPLELVEQM